MKKFLLFSLLIITLFGSSPSFAQIKLGTFTPIPTQIQNSPAPTTKPTLIAPPSTTITPATTQIPKDCSLVNTQDIIDSVSENKIREYLQYIASTVRTRWSAYEGNRLAAAYIKTHFDTLGLESQYQAVPSAYNSNNIIGKIRGQSENEVYLIIGHMDSTSPQTNDDPAPGADDNGSGTAVVMETARVLKQSGLCPKYSLEFIGFSGEEMGLLGSKFYVSNIPQGKIIKGVINLDMVAHAPSGDCVEFYAAPYNGGGIIANKIAEVNTKYGIGLNVRVISGTNGGSDHYPFEVKGHPAVFGIECVFNSVVYHKPTDTIEKLGYGQISKTAKVVAATVATLVSE